MEEQRGPVVGRLSGEQRGPINWGVVEVEFPCGCWGHQAGEGEFQVKGACPSHGGCAGHEEVEG